MNLANGASQAQPSGGGGGNFWNWINSFNINFKGIVMKKTLNKFYLYILIITSLVMFTNCGTTPTLPGEVCTYTGLVCDYSGLICDQFPDACFYVTVACTNLAMLCDTSLTVSQHQQVLETLQKNNEAFKSHLETKTVD